MDDPLASEAAALTELGLNELGTAVDGIHKVQRAISERVFRLVGLGVGPAAKPVKVVYDAITDGVYSTISHVATTAAPIAGKPCTTRPQASCPIRPVAHASSRCCRV